eukprot:2461460-Amphidinium_carterae.1
MALRGHSSADYEVSSEDEEAEQHHAHLSARDLHPAGAANAGWNLDPRLDMFGFSAAVQVHVRFRQGGV